MEVQITLTVDLGDNSVNRFNRDSMQWLMKYVLTSDPNNYTLHSKELGDELGTIVSVDEVKLLP